MAINSKKSCCFRIGQRHNNPCALLCTLSGDLISWVDELRYLGVIIMRSRAFKCSLHHANKLFYRSVNAIFGEIGRIASKEVVLQLIISKCIQGRIQGGPPALFLAKSILFFTLYTMSEKIFLKLNFNFIMVEIRGVFGSVGVCVCVCVCVIPQAYTTNQSFLSIISVGFEIVAAIVFCSAKAQF